MNTTFNHLLCAIVISVSLLFCPTVTTAQWVQTHGPDGGLIHSFAASGTDIFAGTNRAGVFRSSDNGASWTAVSNGLTNTDVLSIAVSGPNLFAGTMGGAFRSTNNGTSWTGINTGLTNPNVFSLLAVSDTNLFAGTNNKVFRSTDNGTTWIAASTGLPGSLNYKISLAVSDTALFVGTGGSGIYRSTNNGTSWTAVNNGMTGTYGYSLLVVGSNLFAGTNSGAFLSTNNGDSWTAISTGLTSSYVLNLGVIGSNLFAGTNDGGVFLSTNDGGSWTSVNNGLTYSNVQSLKVLGTNLFAGTYRGGVFLSTNNGSDWAAANKGLVNTDVNALLLSGTELYAGTSNGVFCSTDNGEAWTRLSNGLTNTDVRSCAISGTDYFAGTEGGSVFRSTDDGQNWTSASIGLPVIPHRAIAVSGSNIFAAGYGAGGGVFLSTNNGDQWVAVNTGLTSTSVISIVTSETYLFAGALGMTGGVFRSSDDGGNWTRVVTGLTNVSVFSLAVSGTDLFAGTYGGGVFLSTNDGDSWTAVNNGLTSTQVLSLATFGTNLFAGTNGGVFLSTNNGSNWTAINSGLTFGLGVNSLTVSGTNLFAGTVCFGAWRRPLSDIVPPVAPGLVTPPNGAIDISTNPTFVWNPSTSATSYRLQVSMDSIFSSPVVDTTGISGISGNVTGLANNTLYYWRVNATNSGGTSGWSGVWNFITVAGTVSIGVSVTDNWNIVSLPVADPTPDDSVNHIFVNLTSPYAFAFNGGYIQVFTLGNGPGYWVKSNIAYTQNIMGTARDTLTIPVPAGWNMIGSISTTIDTSAAHVTPTPADLRGSNYFRYNAGYVIASTIEPGLGYWVKANSNGTFFMHATGPAGKVSTTTSGKSVQDLNTLTVSDANGGLQTLYFGADQNSEIPVDMYVMPPAPPAGSFDARFTSAEGGLMVQTHPSAVSEMIELPIAIQASGYPLTITWKIARADAMYELGDVAGGARALHGEGTMKVSNSSVDRLVLKVTSGNELPKEFSLSQNYPNPFNPTTQIKYALPKESVVTLKVYNMLGQNVATLLSDQEAAGYHSIVWGGTNQAGAQVASGVYFYRIDAQPADGGHAFTSVKKLLLLR